MSHYVIEYVLAQDSDGFASSNVTTKLTVNESQTSTVITNLFPGTIYKFRVAVMNKNHNLVRLSVVSFKHWVSL